MMGNPLRWLPLVVLIPAVLPSGRLAAQSDLRLVDAVRLAREGRSDSARSVVARILASASPSDSAYPEILYTAGLVAATERERRLALRQVVVDHAQSAWADDALLRLAELDYATGNPEGTVRQADQLIRDYPDSPLQAAAALWGARAASDRRDPASACRLANLGLGAVGSNVELRNQLEFQRQRCQGLLALRAESLRQDSLTRARGRAAQPPSRRAASGYYVQLSAVATQSAANVEIARAQRAGYQARAVRESGLYKIRLGPYRNRGEADRALAAARSRLGGRPFVVRIP
ncbi:MAG: SPOR domain-containing protein [Gemmatimonadales bacterium]